MSYFAVAATRADDVWEAAEIDLDSAGDLDDVIDVVRDVDSNAEISLLFVEADDEYLVILRLNNGDDARVFGSDAPFAEESRLGGVLLSDIETDLAPAAADNGDDEELDATVMSELDAQPVGEADLLADLNVPASTLLGLCAKDGMLPSDVTAEVAALIGCGDVVDEVHD